MKYYIVSKYIGIDIKSHRVIEALNIEEALNILCPDEVINLKLQDSIDYPPNQEHRV